MHLSQAALPPDLEQTLHMVHEYRKGGRLAEAEALCRQRLVPYPRQPDLLGQLAELLMQKADFQSALPLLEQAREAVPGRAQYWLLQTQCLLALERNKEAKKIISEAIRLGLRHPLADELLKQARAEGKKKTEKPVSLGVALRELDALFRAGRHAKLEEVCRELRQRYPQAPQIPYLLGMAALAQGRPQDAVTPLAQAVKLDPAMAPAQFNLGFCLESLGRLDEALAAYRQTLAIAPQLADAHNNLGNVLQKLKRHEEALAAYESALALRPENPGFHRNRGDALRDLSRLDEAVLAYEKAIRSDPGQMEAYVNLALVLHLLGRYEASMEASQRAIERCPDYSEAYQNLGHALRELERHEEAAAAYRRAIEIKPNDSESHKELGVALKDSGNYGAALTSLRRALELQPDSEAIINLLAGALLDAGRHDEALETYRRGLALNPEGGFGMHSNLLLALNYQGGATPEVQLTEARAFGEKAARKAVPFAKHVNLPDPDRRLRIGLVSGDLGQHPVGFFLLNVLVNLDPDRLEVFAYATTHRKDAINERLRRSIPCWCDASPAKMDDKALANRIRSDGIDILIDLAGHTAKNRLPVFAWKPAPVQVSWLGYLGTTGLDAMDYVLADAWALLAGEEVQFTETPWRLPEAYICFSPPDVPVEVWPLAALDKGYVTFGCFNNLNKISEEVVACWARVLQAVPNARLYLKSKSLGAAEMRQKLMASFGRFGVSSERLVLGGTLASQEEHFRAYRQVDIALDPFPYPGITTTVEALWMGVPVLSLKGQRFISHQGETILHNVGLSEWVAADVDDYVAKAEAFAGDIKALAALHSGLRGKLLASPLCGAPRFAKNFEVALRGMWRKWCEGKGV